MLVRYGVAALIACMIVSVLMISMYTLIKMADPVLEKSTPFTLPDFIYIKPDQPLNTLTAKPEKLPKPEVQPDKPKVEPIDDHLDLDKVGIARIHLQMASNVQNGIGLSPGDGEYLPIVKIAPVYPRAAQRRCLEGHVIVAFTVTKNGSVKNPQVVSSTSTLFESSAKKAALKFKYKPRIVDGKPIESSGVQNKIVYIMKGCQ